MPCGIHGIRSVNVDVAAKVSATMVAAGSIATIVPNDFKHRASVWSGLNNMHRLWIM